MSGGGYCDSLISLPVGFWFQENSFAEILNWLPQR